jgi:lactate dehydrogenase-like 2-hydroxyacid dehydrogenase
MFLLMKASLLVTKRLFPQAIDYLRERAEVEYHDSQESYPPDELLNRLRTKDGVVSQVTDHFTAEVINALPKLRVIANVAAGLDNIDVKAATARNILVTNTPGALTETTADFTFALILAAGRRLAEGDRFVRAGRWREWSVDLLCGPDIHHRTLGLIGLGRIGQAVARRARGFDMRVVYHDVVRRDPQTEKEIGAGFVPFDTLLRESDYISLHVPLLPETRKLIGRSELAQMKKAAILVNTSRGPVVDETALAEALANGTIAAAGLDVFEREPQVEPRLLALENVVLAPHIASASVDTRTTMCMMAAENAVEALAGRRPPNLVNTSLMD